MLIVTRRDNGSCNENKNEHEGHSRLGTLIKENNMRLFPQAKYGTF